MLEMTWLSSNIPIHRYKGDSLYYFFKGNEITDIFIYLYMPMNNDFFCLPAEENPFCSCWGYKHLKMSKKNRRENCQWQKAVTLLVLGCILCIQGIAVVREKTLCPLQWTISSATLSPGNCVGDDLTYHCSLQTNPSFGLHIDLTGLLFRWEGQIK